MKKINNFNSLRWYVLKGSRKDQLPKGMYLFKKKPPDTK